MESGYEEICRAAMADPGGRGLSSHADGLPPLKALAESLAGAKGAMLISGFPVRTAKGVVGETDGPSGIAWLAGALTRLGVPVRVYTGPYCQPQIKAALALAAPRASLCLLPHRGGAGYARREWEDFAPTHLIALERPGKGADGICRNAKGEPIDEWVADAEPLFEAAKAQGAVTVAVGDGGNELGMGGLRPLIERYVEKGGLICARQQADYTLMGGVSNWWGWGLCGALSLTAGRDLLPTPGQEEALLDAVLSSGGADGATARFEPTVDAMPLQDHLRVLGQMRRAVEEALNACPV